MDALPTSEVKDPRVRKLLATGCEIRETAVNAQKDANDGVLGEAFDLKVSSMTNEGLKLSAHVHELPGTHHIFYTVHFSLDTAKYALWFNKNIDRFQGISLQQIGPFQMSHPGLDPQFFANKIPKRPNPRHSEFFTVEDVDKDFLPIMIEEVIYRVERSVPYPDRWIMVRVK